MLDVWARQVALWSVPQKGADVAAYPKEHHPSGTALVLFDTALEPTLLPLRKATGDAHMIGSAPSWIMFGGQSFGVRWPYDKDVSANIHTMATAKNKECYTPWSGAQCTGKRLAGDGMSHETDLNWEF